MKPNNKKRISEPRSIRLFRKIMNNIWAQQDNRECRDEDGFLDYELHRKNCPPTENYVQVGKPQKGVTSKLTKECKECLGFLIHCKDKKCKAIESHCPSVFVKEDLKEYKQKLIKRLQGMKLKKTPLAKEFEEGLVTGNNEVLDEVEAVIREDK